MHLLYQIKYVKKCSLNAVIIILVPIQQLPTMSDPAAWFWGVNILGGDRLVLRTCCLRGLHRLRQGVVLMPLQGLIEELGDDHHFQKLTSGRTKSLTRAEKKGRLASASPRRTGSKSQDFIAALRAQNSSVVYQAFITRTERVWFERLIHPLSQRSTTRHKKGVRNDIQSRCINDCKLPFILHIGRKYSMACAGR
eukprot:432946-Amphidinium_carterae.1